MSSLPTVLNFRLIRLILTVGLATALVLTLLVSLPGPARAGGAVLFVDADATGGATGMSWTDAYTNVQDGLVAAVGGDQVWVAEGVYYPDEGGEQPADAVTTTFTLADGVALYGGFNGTESQLEQRDAAANLTVLSGDIDKNDLTDPNGVVTDTVNMAGANAHHVVTGAGAGGGAVLDGFTITAGRAVFPNDRGGGMYNVGGSPTLIAVTFSGNRADNSGGGMYNDGSSPVLSKVAFTGNSAGSGGGGMANNNGSAPSLTDVTFTGNNAFAGGGLHNGNSSSPTLVGVTFSSNSAGGDGGGLFNSNSNPTLIAVTFNDNSGLDGGGMANNLSSPTLTDVTFSGNSAISHGGGMISENNSSPMLTNVTFAGNGAAYGGGMANISSDPILTGAVFTGNSANSGGGLSNLTSFPTLTNGIFSGNSANNNGGGMENAQSDPTLINITFSGNSANGNGGGLANGNSTPTLINTIMWGDSAATGPEIYNSSSSPAISYSDVQGCGGSGSWDTACGMDNGNNIDADPLFVDPDGAENMAGTLDDDLRLSAGSPAIDAGENKICPPSDLDALPRPIDGDGNDQANCDMGAYEYQIATATTILSDDLDPSGPGEVFTVMVSVTATMGTPTGAMTVTVVGNPDSCSGMLSGGVASCTLMLATPGTYTLTATYPGEGAFSPSSATEDHTVETNGFGLYLPIIRRD